MTRRQYEKDVAIWNPEGRLLQVEYAQNSVNLGSAAAGLKNEQYAVIVALQRPASLANEKIITVCDYVGAAICGVAPDGNELAEFLRAHHHIYRYQYHSIISMKCLMELLGNKMQVATTKFGQRPFGAGLVVAGYDLLGPHIYEMNPSANFMHCKAIAMGAGSHLARSYLEANLAAFPCSSVEQLICHGIKALERTFADTDPNCKQEERKISVGLVGPKQPFRLISDQDTQCYVQLAKRGDEGK